MTAIAATATVTATVVTATAVTATETGIVIAIVVAVIALVHAHAIETVALQLVTLMSIIRGLRARSLKTRGSRKRHSVTPARSIFLVFPQMSPWKNSSRFLE